MSTVIYDIDLLRFYVVGLDDVLFGIFGDSGNPCAISGKLWREIGHISLVRGFQIVRAMFEVEIMDDRQRRNLGVKCHISVRR